MVLVSQKNRIVIHKNQLRDVLKKLPVNHLQVDPVATRIKNRYFLKDLGEVQYW